MPAPSRHCALLALIPRLAASGALIVGDRCSSSPTPARLPRVHLEPRQDEPCRAASPFVPSRAERGLALDARRSPRGDRPTCPSAHARCRAHVRRRCGTVLVRRRQGRCSDADAGAHRRWPGPPFRPGSDRRGRPHSRRPDRRWLDHSGDPALPARLLLPLDSRAGRVRQALDAVLARPRSAASSRGLSRPARRFLLRDVHRQAAELPASGARKSRRAAPPRRARPAITPAADRSGSGWKGLAAPRSARRRISCSAIMGLARRAGADQPVQRHRHRPLPCERRHRLVLEDREASPAPPRRAAATASRSGSRPCASIPAPRRATR